MFDLSINCRRTLNTIPPGIRRTPLASEPLLPSHECIGVFSMGVTIDGDLG